MKVPSTINATRKSHRIIISNGILGNLFAGFLMDVAGVFLCNYSAVESMAQGG
jgi:hypothetical protein